MGPSLATMSFMAGLGIDINAVSRTREEAAYSEFLGYIG